MGYGSAVAYGLLIPSFLIYLIVKQNIVLAPNRRCVSWAQVDGHKKVTVRASLLEPLVEDGETDEEGLRVPCMLLRAPEISGISH